MHNIDSITCTYMGDSLRPTCCAPRVEGRSYCKDHLWLVYKEGSNLRTRHKDIRTVDKVRMVEQLMNEAIAELEEEGFDCYGNKELDIN